LIWPTFTFYGSRDQSQKLWDLILLRENICESKEEVSRSVVTRVQVVIHFAYLFSFLFTLSLINDSLVKTLLKVMCLIAFIIVVVDKFVDHF
jgi:hypothetical protein